MLSVSDRSKGILDELVNNPSITSMDLEKKFNLTRRQLGYSFDKINEWLMAKNLPAIERTRKGHFIIDQSVFTRLSNEDQSIPVDTIILSEEQRVYLIILMLLSGEEELSLSHFTIEFDVSKNTILSDLKQVQIHLNDYDLVLHYSRKLGYVLAGKEFQIRKLLITVTYQLLHMPGGKSRVKKLTRIQTGEINEFNKRIENVESKLNLKFTDEKMTTMPYILLLILRRIKQGCEVNFFSIQYEELSNTKE